MLWNSTFPFQDHPAVVPTAAVPISVPSDDFPPSPLEKEKEKEGRAFSPVPWAGIWGVNPGANPPAEAVGAVLVPSVPTVPWDAAAPLLYFPEVSLALGSVAGLRTEPCRYRGWIAVLSAALPFPSPSGNFLLLCNFNNSIVGLCFIPQAWSHPRPSACPQPCSAAQLHLSLNSNVPI